MITIKANIFGRVQGVNFRVSIKNYCDKQEINGYVANKEDGSVLLVAQSEKKKIDKLMKWIKSSPKFSHVEKIETSKINSIEYEDFRIKMNGDFLEDKMKSLRNLKKRLLGK